MAELIKKGNARSSGYEASSNEWYTETPKCVDLLLDAEPLEGLTWDPACGGGNIPSRIVSRGGLACGSDIIDRCGGMWGVLDFLDDYIEIQNRPKNIVTNPPFSLAVDFVQRGLDLVGGKVIVLQRLAWLEGKKRREFFLDTHLTHVWVHSSRQSMPPGGSNIEPKGGAVAYAWFVWDRQQAPLPTTIGFLP